MDVFERLWSELGSHGVMVLSTCAGNRVTSRSMSVVVYGGRFYCQTNVNYLKCRQIEQNPNVSLCCGSHVTEGECRIAGKPSEIPGFIAAMERAFPDAVKRWSALPEERVLEITPAEVRSWVYEDGIPYIEIWDMKEETYRKERQ